MKIRNKHRNVSSLLVLLIGIATTVMLSACQMTEQAEEKSTPIPTQTFTPEPIVPTRTPVPTAVATVVPVATLSATLIPTPVNTPTVAPEQSETPEPEPDNEEPVRFSELNRFGITGAIEDASSALEAGLPFGALLNWHVNVDPPDDFLFWQMVRTSEEGIRSTSWEEIELAIHENPGSYWMVGNEPDVRWQDNVTPQRYAEIYHEVYTFVKERDPEAKIVIGGVTQPTPLRRAYLDIVLDTYKESYGQEMPIDVWNVHAFTLREELDSWGVDIPPGMDDSLAIRYELADHDNLEILEENLIDFRSWMADRGYGDKPLIISEYGILMPEDYGFPPERVAEFMIGSFRLFQTLSGDTGYESDQGRLVQQWFWFSVSDPYLYPTGDLYNPTNGQLTALGEVWTEYIQGFLAEPNLLP